MARKAACAEREASEFAQAFEVRLSDSEWTDLKAFIYRHAGIKLSEAKRVFLVSRLLRRLRAVGARTFGEYYELVARAGVESEEHQLLLNAVTTNKTEFFREREHFELLVRWLRIPTPEMGRSRASGLKIWCAAASTGEEPYTLAAVLREGLQEAEWSRATIWASDIDTAVLAKAKRAVYDAGAVASVEGTWRTKMFVQGRGDYRNWSRVRRDLREHVRLFQFNLTRADWPRRGLFDAIFCRNVLIYFDRPTQERVVERLLQHLAPHGLLFLGHAESLNGLSIGAQMVAHSAYAHAGSVVTAHLGKPRAVAFRAGPSSGNRAGERPKGSRALRRGQTVVDAPRWLRLRLEGGILLVAWSERASASRYFDAAGAVDAIEAIVLEAVELSKAARGGSAAHDPMRLKVIIGLREPGAAPVDSVELAAALSAEGLELVALRQLDVPTTILVHGSSGRVRLLRAASSCRIASEKAQAAICSSPWSDQE